MIKILKNISFIISAVTGIILMLLIISQLFINYTEKEKALMILLSLVSLLFLFLSDPKEIFKFNKDWD